MAVNSRYSNDDTINLGQQLGTAHSAKVLRFALKQGIISVRKTIIATGSDRLDSLAGALYGDSRYWWVLAAASDIGWGMQVPPGTVINVLDISDVVRLV